MPLGKETGVRTVFIHTGGLSLWVSLEPVSGFIGVPLAVRHPFGSQPANFVERRAGVTLQCPLFLSHP